MARDLPSKSWHNLHSLLQKEDSLFDVLSYLQGVTWEACVQIHEQDKTSNRVMARDSTLVTWASMRCTVLVYMSFRDIALRFGRQQADSDSKTRSQRLGHLGSETRSRRLGVSDSELKTRSWRLGVQTKGRRLGVEDSESEGLGVEDSESETPSQRLRGRVRDSES